MQIGGRDRATDQGNAVIVVRPARRVCGGVPSGALISAVTFPIIAASDRHTPADDGDRLLSAVSRSTIARRVAIVQAAVSARERAAAFVTAARMFRST